MLHKNNINSGSCATNCVEAHAGPPRHLRRILQGTHELEVVSVAREDFSAPTGITRVLKPWLVRRPAIFSSESLTGILDAPRILQKRAATIC